MYFLQIMNWLSKFLANYKKEQIGSSYHFCQGFKIFC